MSDVILTTTVVKRPSRVQRTREQFAAALAAAASGGKRLRRTNGELAALDNQIVEVLQECHPQSVRHVYYCMTDTRLAVSVPKTDKGAGSGYGVVQRRLSKMRENGRIPFGWIVDFTRRSLTIALQTFCAGPHQPIVRISGCRPKATSRFGQNLDL